MNFEISTNISKHSQTDNSSMKLEKPQTNGQIIFQKIYKKDE
jgi:hypothetical protein